MKKGQSLSINTIIVAALALVVFVILAAIFSGKFRIFGEGLESCASKQGQCKPCLSPPDCYNSCGSNAGIITKTDCEKNGRKEVCCIQAFS